MPSTKDFDRYAPIAAWTAPQDMDMTLPSGQVVLVRKIQMEDVVDLGLVEALDMFQEIAGKGNDAVASAGKTKKAKAEAEESFGMSMMKDREGFKKILRLADRVTVATVVKPRIEFPVAGPDGKALPMIDREPGLYVDQVPFEDKMHIFSSIFKGMEELDSFREESGEDVADIPAVADVPLPTKRNASARSRS